MMKQTTLIAILTVAVMALVIDRLVPVAEADDINEPHVLLTQVWMGVNWGTVLSQEFSSRDRCQAAAGAVKQMKGSQKTHCLPR